MKWAAVASCACASAATPPLDNRIERVRCEVPARMVMEAHRYANLDHDDPDFDKWTPASVTITLDAEPAIMENAHGHVRLARGRVRIDGDRATVALGADGAIACEQHRLALRMGDHEPWDADIDLIARTGVIKSIDAWWYLGPPFPAHPR